MIKNLSDLLSIVTLILLSVASLRLFALSNGKVDKSNKKSIKTLMSEYIYNEDE